MIKKDYYVIQQKLKYGPISKDQLLEKFEAGYWDESAIVEDRDTDKVISLMDFYVDSLREKFTPPTPAPQKREPELEPEPVILKPEVLIEPPPIPKKEKKIEPEILTKVKKESTFSFKIFLVPIVLLLMVLLRDLYIFRFQNAPRPANMNILDYERYQKLSTHHQGFSSAVQLAISKDNKQFWLFTDNPLDAQVEVTLEGLQNKYLGKEPVRFKALGYLTKHRAEFSQFEFEKGSRIYPGYYQVEIKSSQEKNPYWLLRYFLTTPTHINKRTILYLASISPEQFKPLLENFLRKKYVGKNRYWEDLQQKYETVEMIILQIIDKFKVFYSGDDELKDLEKDYAKSFGSFFSDLVIRNQNSHVELRNFQSSDRDKMIEYYQKLSEICKSFGVKISLMFDSLAKNKNKPTYQEVEKEMLATQADVIKTKEEIESYLK